jgi:hypothetical protein
VALVFPCLWRSNLQAGDLSSHLYNAWLVQLIHRGQAPGLSIATQSTNVLFDWILSALLALTGPAAAQRIAVVLAVLVFVRGAFAFVSAVAGKRAWDVLPFLAILAYGWVFRVGLFNFYLSLGLCFWALALAWSFPRRLPAVLAILIAAYVAHGLPPVWAAGVLIYRAVWIRVPGRARLFAAGILVAMVALSVAMALTLRIQWSFSQLLLTTGADQAYIYDSKYQWISIGILLLWASIAWKSRKALTGLPFHIWALTAAGILIFPTSAWLPQYHHALAFIAERMSLAAGVCLCAALAGTQTAAWQRYAIAAVTAIFLLFVYTDEGALNDLEERIAAATSRVPPEGRVVTSIHTSQLRTNPIDHMIDRVCIGHCYSYANYEPSSGQFRVRVTGPTTIVAPTDMDSSRMQTGGYAVKPRDLPLFRISLSNTGEIVVQEMPPGALIDATWWNGL